MLNASVIGLITFLLPFFISDVMHRGSGLLSAALVFFVATSALITPMAGMLADRFRPLPVAAWGGALTVAALLPMLTLTPDTGLAGLGWRMALLGAGMALFNSPNMTAILQTTPRTAPARSEESPTWHAPWEPPSAQRLPPSAGPWAPAAQTDSAQASQHSSC